ncbi:MAG: sporulation protein YtfJ [Ruminococcaceae bacterium]|nr:sporulation protein YtfJ [Oscillospiraceae bacterium]MBQ7118659.1 GerW family sporulation protein [Oscillospiraceae bacterium]
MAECTLNEVMKTTMDKIRSMVDVNTIIGDAITTPDGTTIIPISKVSFGFATGGSDFDSKKEGVNFGGGTGAGVTIKPEGFLVVNDGNVRLVPMAVAPSTTLDRLVELLPEIITKVEGYFKKNKKEAE